MKKLLALALLLAACAKKEEAAPAAKTEASSEKPIAPAEASASAKTSTSSASSGAYASKQAEVRMPEDAPPFIHPESKEGIGEGELSLTLPSGTGAVIGKASGALGAQTFSGWLEGDRLTGTLAPDVGATPMLWGVVDGKNDNGAVTGTIRASSNDGRVVREATFTLKKK